MESRAAGHFLLVDGSGFVHRAWHSGNPHYRPVDGQPIGACLAFLGMIWNLLGTAQADRPTHGVCIFDAPGKHFRHRLDPAYKANRPHEARSLELEDQIPLMQHSAESLGIRPVQIKGWEGDDALASFAVAAKKAGIRTTLVTADKDLSALVEDGVIEIYDTYHRKRLREADVETKMGVPPAQIPHLLALEGDTVDNIPGVPGVGRDKAARLVRRYGSVEGVLANAKEVRWPAIRHQLVKKAVQDRIRLNLKLTTLRRNIKLPVSPQDLVLEPVMKSHLKEILRVLGASHHMEAIFAMDPQIARPVPALAPGEAPLGWWSEEILHPGQRVPETPQCGFYMRKLVKGGPFVPAAIWREPQTDPITGEPTGMELLRCTVAGQPRDPLAEWVRLSMTPIKQADYEFEGAAAAYAKKWNPDSPRANPTKPIQIDQQPASRNPRRKSHV